MDFASIKEIIIPEGNVKEISCNGIVIWSARDVDYLCFTAKEENSTISMSVVETPSEINLETSFDKSNWTEFIPGTTIITLENIDDAVYFRGTNQTINSNKTSYYKFVITNQVEASGNIMALLSRYGANIVPEYCFYKMFEGCTGLLTSPDLPALSISSHGYSNMFQGCTSLTSTSDLPATTIDKYCYQYMFDGCTNLTSVPLTLPALTLSDYCYQDMFKGCINLVNVPSLPALNLAKNCYSTMFKNCTSLVVEPYLPATELAEYCYDAMFSNCKSLITTYDLPAIILAKGCCRSMFDRCTSLKVPIKLPAATIVDSAYETMYYGCASIKMSKTQTENYNKPYRIPSELDGTGLSSYLDKMFYATGGTFRGAPDLNTIYYYDDGDA